MQRTNQLSTHHILVHTLGSCCCKDTACTLTARALTQLEHCCLLETRVLLLPLIELLLLLLPAPFQHSPPTAAERMPMFITYKIMSRPN